MSCEFVFGALHGTFLIVTLTIAGLSFALRERAIVCSVSGLFEGVSMIASGCFAQTLGTCTQWCLISWLIRPF